MTVLQNFNEALFATPTTSSNSSPPRQFQANDGTTLDAANGWVADGGVPQTLTLTFDSPKTIYRVILADLVIAGGNVTAATLGFSNGDTIAVPALDDAGAEMEFVFAPKTVSSITVTIDANTGFVGLSEFGAFSALAPDQSTVVVDLFNDGNAAVDARWTEVDDDCRLSDSTWSAAPTSEGANGEYVQTGNCLGIAAEGVEFGAYQISTVDTFDDMDLRLRVTSRNVNTIGSNTSFENGPIGVLFGYSTNDNYYRLDLSQAEGHIKLWKRVAGVFTELTTSPQSFTPDMPVNLRIVREVSGATTSVIVVYVDSVKVMAVEDTEAPLNNSPFQVGLLCGSNESCTFDNFIVLTSPSTPIVGLNIDDDGITPGHTSGEYYVDSGDTLNAFAAVTNTTGITGVEFVLDEGLAGEVSSTDTSAPFTASFPTLAAGNHSVRAYLQNSGGRIAATGAVNDDAADELPMVATGGIHLVGIGDSITTGLRDIDRGDDTSTDGRNTSGGYPPILNNVLTAANGVPVTVINEGNPNEGSPEAITSVAAVLLRTPGAQGYLSIYGANDSNASILTPSGLGLIPGDAGYDGSFKDNMQQIIDAVTAAGKAIFLAKTLPVMGDAVRNTIVQGYNDVIDELISENFFNYTAPDFHTYFTNNPGEMADNLHPNGAGYVSMANNSADQDWCAVLNNQIGIICP